MKEILQIKSRQDELERLQQATGSSKKFLLESQHGFRKARSTMTALAIIFNGTIAYIHQNIIFIIFFFSFLRSSNSKI